MAKKVVILGATGTAGQATARALASEGHEVHALVRDVSAVPHGVASISCDVTDRSAVRSVLSELQPEVLVSCLASRTGLKDDAWAIDYGVHAEALKIARDLGVRHVVYLSAICVQKPLLAFQKAKLAFEADLVASGLTYSIVRPTAFFKSLSGQAERLRAGRKYMMFGDGALTACTPISDRDLGRFIASCLVEPSRQNAILPIGGPGPALTPLEQGALLAEAMGVEFRVSRVPVRLLDGIIWLADLLGHVSSKWRDRAEFARIGRYYATESMLVWDGARYDRDATPTFGEDTLADHYTALARGETTTDLREHAVF